MTVTPRSRRRGEPLLVLAALLTGWIGLRATMWDAGFEVVPAPVERIAGRSEDNARDPKRRVLPMQRAGKRGHGATNGSAAHRFAPLHGTRQGPFLPMVHPVESLAPKVQSRDVRVPEMGNVRAVAGHQLLLMAALGYVTLPEIATRALSTMNPAPQPVPPAGTSRTSRWSADGWVLARRDGGEAALLPGAPGYGGSQAGAVLRYRLHDGGRAAPYLYARVSGALGRPGGDRDVAAGIGVRPVPSMPLRLLAEARVTQSTGKARVRPAATVVTELAPQRLPMGVKAEVYAQAGYVGGKGATAFFDLQAVADKRVAATGGNMELRLGGGAWAGGQRGAARLDLGPRASARLRVQGTASRVAFDWRFRVAGNARPGSGPAITVSAGF
ncbi:hypothetical protein RXV95_14630 [Novosphingobium sp. ZN18A2]|uniref:hypothetical protein n=1 Tax=Novosphingobium sp. ZN18A2 TaxID=3079861 RepID=UPI0030CE9A70